MKPRHYEPPLQANQCKGVARTKAKQPDLMLLSPACEPERLFFYLFFFLFRPLLFAPIRQISP